MKRTPLPARVTPLRRGAPLQARTPLSARSPLAPAAATRKTGLRPVSVKRARENRERAAMADRRWPDRRDGTVMCECGRPECNRRADDLHEILTRARGGSITDEANCIPLARECHEELTSRPTSELGWAYEAGLLCHSWDAVGGAA